MTKTTDLPKLPPNIPSYGNRFTRWIGRTLMRMSGWSIKGDLPNEKKMVVILSPHTSNWDFVYCMYALTGLSLRISYMMKKEAFFWPLGGLFKALGGLPIDRKAAQDTVGQVADWFDKSDALWVAITPEGSRSRTSKWKTGFLRIAQQADVPILLVGWDYPSKSFCIDHMFRAGEDFDAEVVRLKKIVDEKYEGKHPEKHRD